MTTRTVLLVAALAAFSSIAAEEKPSEKPQEPPAEKPAGEQSKPAARVTDFEYFTIEPPAAWTADEVAAGGMRKAQYKMPAPAAGGVAAEFVVFFFGKGQGGPPMANIDRWKSQFKKPEGMTDEEHAQVLKQEVAGMKLTIVELRGDYAGMSAAGVPDAEAKKDHMMLAAVIETEGGNYFFRALGTRATVEHWKKDWYAMTLGLKAKKPA